MSRADVMGLGPFLKTLEQRLERLTKDEICRIVVQRAKTIPSVERRGFVTQFESAPPATAERHLAEDDTTFLSDIREFIADLERGTYYEGTGFDTEIRDYRSYGDESWVEDMDELFDRAGDAYLDGRKALAAEAYGLLLHAFDMENDDGHFCGATLATEMVATDINEAKARYLRALYETTPIAERPRQLLKEMHALRYRGQADAGFKVVLEANTAPLPEWNVFLPTWIEELRKQDLDSADLILKQMLQRLLREAVMMRDGLIGMAGLAEERGAIDPNIFRDWLDELVRLNRLDEARQVARKAMDVVGKPADKARFAERWAMLAGTADETVEARRMAWRCSPQIDRLLRLFTANAPTPEESRQRMVGELQEFRNGKMTLDHRTAAVLCILAGEYAAAANVLERADPLGWSSYQHPGEVVYPFLLLAIVGEQALPKGSVLSLWRHELDATDRVAPCVAADGETVLPPIGLWMVMQTTRKHIPLTTTQREEFLDLTRKVMQARVKDILANQHRGAYDRAARLLVGWIEAARFAGRRDEAATLLERIGKDYSRRPAFRRELALLQKTDGKTPMKE